MEKGFWQKKKERLSISVQSIICSRTGEPLVLLEWGKESGAVKPDVARAYALSILGAAAAAEADAVVVRWADKELGMASEKVESLRGLFRKQRETGKLPNATIDFDGDHLTPNEVRECALEMLFVAFSSEMEAFLAAFLIEQVGSDEAQVNLVISQLRKMQHLETAETAET